MGSPAPVLATCCWGQLGPGLQLPSSIYGDRGFTEPAHMGW